MGLTRVTGAPYSGVMNTNQTATAALREQLAPHLQSMTRDELTAYVAKVETSNLPAWAREAAATLAREVAVTKALREALSA